jgi:hypothetical protein
MSWILDVARTVQDSAVGSAIAESAYLYPLIEAVHLLGLGISVGLVLLVDLRLLGLTLNRLPAQTLLRGVRPWFLWGFAVTFASGVLLLASEATSVVLNAAFLAKLVFIALAGINALWFEHLIRTTPLPADAAARVSRKVQLAGLSSLLLWVAVIVCGRLIPNLVNEAGPPKQAASSAPAEQTGSALATLQITMLRDIDPAADAIWDSNGTVVTAQGTKDTRPTTDADWATLRQHAQTLIRSAAVLADPQLQVSAAGVVIEGTGVPGVRTPAQIQQAIGVQRTQFLAHVAELRRGAELAVVAIDKKDTQALFEAGGVYYEACTACHNQFWATPDERRPALPRNINLAPKPL